jgi:hypothetical protein
MNYEQSTVNDETVIGEKVQRNNKAMVQWCNGAQ